MVVWDKKIVWVFMFLVAGAVDVKYPPPVCAVTGSTVTLPCTFTPLKSVIQDGEEVLIEIVRVRWCRNHEICQGPTPSVYDSDSTNDNSPRYRYLGDMKGNCTLQVTDVQEEDEGILRFRMEANNKGGHFTERSGVSVTVTESTQMRINSSINETVLREGETITLLCTALCTFHHLEVTWFRDGHALSESGPALRLGPLTAGDSGNYTCALNSSSLTLSVPYSLQVEAGEEGPDDDLSLIVGVVFGVLLVLFTLIMVVCIIRRRRAADKGQGGSAGGEMEQTPAGDMYSNMQEGGGHRQEASRAVDDVSYASVQFQHKNQARSAQQQQQQQQQEEDAIIYSSVASRG